MASEETVIKGKSDHLNEEEDDDDMPDLESVGSSEYSDEEDNGICSKPTTEPGKGNENGEEDPRPTETTQEDVKTKEPVPEDVKPKEPISEDLKNKDPTPEDVQDKETCSPSPTENGSLFRDDYDYSHIAHWRYRYSSEAVREPARKIKVQLLSPFLFGTFSVADKWINWLHDAGLLPSKSEWNTGELSDRELLAVETVERAANEASPFMDTVHQKERGLFDTFVDAVDPCNTLLEVARTVREFKWFSERLHNVVPPWNADREPPNEHFYVIAFVYAIVITVKKSELCDSDSEMSEDQTTREGEKCRIKGNEYYKNDDYRPAIRAYTNAINMCPFSHEAYGNRAIAYLKMREYQAALSDSYRCIVLNPDGWKGYSRYSCALRALGEEVKAECIYHEVQTCLPHYKSTLTQEWSKFSEIFSKLSIKKEKEERKRAASPEESDPKAVEGAEKKGDKPKKKSKKQEMQQKKLTKKFEVINEHLKRGSLSLRQHDPHTSSEEFERALQLIGENKSKWAENEGADCNKLFNVILYLNAKAEFEMGSMARVENLLSNISHNKSLFPACHLLTARGQMCAHRYKDAERSLYQALTQLPIYARNFTTINWPGLKEPIEELRPSALEWTIRRLREFCTPRGTPDYICRYHGCSQHHLTSSIYLNDRANKECIVIVCWSGCSLSVHHDCWKRQREELVITNDKDMLGQACLTPDCDGTIVEIRILEGHNVKYRMQSSERREPLKPVIVKANRQPVCSEAHKKRILRKKLEALNRKSQATTTASKSSLNTQDIQASTRETVSESIPKSPQSDSRTGSELLQREQECEEGLDKKEGKQRKAKKKKSKGSDEHSNSAAAEISQLFTLASNDGRTIISANDDIDHSGNLVSSEISSEGPFQVPERLKSAHQQFEQQFTLERGRGEQQFTLEKGRGEQQSTLERGRGEQQSTLERGRGEQQSTSEKGRGEMGASMQPDPEAPLSRPFNTVVKSSPKPPLTSTEEGLLQYFEDVLREHGPLKCNSQYLQDALDLLHIDQKEIIGFKQNGLHNFLLLSPRVKFHEGIICLQEFSSVVVESIRMEQSRSYSALAKNTERELSERGEGEGNKRQPSEGEERGHRRKSSDKGEGGERGHRGKLSDKGEGGERGHKKQSNEGGDRGYVKEEKDVNLSPQLSVASETEDSGMFGGMFDSLSSTTPPLRTNSYSSQWSVEGVCTSISSSHTHDPAPSVTPPVALVKKPPVTKEKGIQTTRIKKVDFAMVTDAISMDNYKQMYENACKERNRLSLKVRSLEDDKVKLKRSHNVEVEKTVKQAAEDARAAADEKVLSMRMQHGDEVRKYEKEKKDKQDQISACKKEIKALHEKLEKAKKDVLKLQEELDAKSSMFQHDREQLLKDNHMMEERIKVSHSTAQLTRERALVAELNLVQIEGDMKVKEIEALIKEAALVSERTKLQDWKAYNEKLITVLEEFKVTISHRIHAIQQGTEYNSLEKVVPSIPPKPQVVINPAAYMQAQLMLQAQAAQAQAMKVQAQAQAQGQLMGLIPGMVPGLVRPQMPVEQAQPGVQPPVVGAGGKLTAPSFPMQPSMPSPVLKQKRGVQQIWEKIQHDYPDLSQEELKDVLREVKAENNNSLAHLTTDRIVHVVRVKLTAKSTNQMPSSVSMTTTAPTVFPSAFPSQSQLGVSSGSVGVSSGGVGVSSDGMGMSSGGVGVSSGEVGVSTSAPGSVLLPMAQNAAMWNMMSLRQQQLSQVHPSLSVPSTSDVSSIHPRGLGGGVQQSKLLQQQFNPMTQPSAFSQGFPPGLLYPRAPPQPAQPSGMAAPFTKQDLIRPPAGGFLRRVAVAAPPKPRAADHIVYGEDECVICAEDMHGDGVLKLDCGHRFHEACVRQWLAEQSTCPTCRDHVKLEEDFPELS